MRVGIVYVQATVGSVGSKLYCKKKLKHYVLRLVAPDLSVILSYELYVSPFLTFGRDRPLEGVYRKTGFIETTWFDCLG